MSTNVVGVGAPPAPHHLGRIAGMVAGIVVAVSIGIGIAQVDSQDLTVDRYHPGHPTVSQDRQDRISELRDSGQPANYPSETSRRVSRPGR